MKVFACFLILFFSYQFAHAHSCATFSGLSAEEYSQKLKQVDNIFQGEVISVEDLGFQSYLIKFKVLKVWKGKKTNEITVKYGNPCGSPVFSVGTKLMVYGYATKNESFIDVNCCNFGLFDDNRTKLELGEGITIEQSSAETTQSPHPEIPEEEFWTSLWKKIISFFS